ncbi:MAG: ImmA/IrrE family metallo-endopeptidase [Verrucomicrobiales bacterium]|nr:ImmA/IrrE family metallo-endopeptidase [Verrucomicrobiales bacterium]
MKISLDRSQPFWTHPSLASLQSGDPISYICSRASALALQAMESGWSGPPYDPVGLAKQIGIGVVPRHDVAEARAVPLHDGRLQIEYNPTKPHARVRFSIAHELAHALLPDCSETIRYRCSREAIRKDDWQLEMVCNVAAAEMLMPTGSFPELKTVDLTIDRVLELRKEFDVSVEAVLLRAVRLTSAPCGVFIASLKQLPSRQERYGLDYTVASRTWRSPLSTGQPLPRNSVATQCIAIGFTSKGDEVWLPSRERLHVECVGLPPFRGQTVPRLAGIVCPVRPGASKIPDIQMIVGNALEPRGTGRKIIAHVVNDKTPNWGAGFALAVRRKWPGVQDAFRSAVASDRALLTLGNVFHTEVQPDTTVLQMICQRGYGPSPTPRLKYSALKDCLEWLAAFATERKASIHMPRIGAGYGGGSWGLIKQLVDESLCAEGLSVTVYELPGDRPPEPKQIGLFDDRRRAG